MLGVGAAALTTAAFLPQVIKAHQSKRTEDLSLLMLVLFAAGLLLWICYGLMISSLPVIVANVITVSLTLYLLYLKLKHG